MNEKRANDIRVLIADDHPLMREGIAALLNGREGFTVVAKATNGLEATQLAKDLKPDVILMDISMPQMNGIEATACIKKIHPDIAIIALTMHDDNGMKDKMFAAGAVAYLNKVASPGVIIDTLREFS